MFLAHITTGPDGVNPSVALAFRVLTAFLVTGSFLWITGDLTHDMPGMEQIMRTQG